MAYSYGPSIVKDGLVLALDAANRKSYSGTGTTWFDLSGNGTNASLENGTAYNSGNGGNMLLDGANDQLSLSNNARLGGSITNFVTISSWFKFNALPVSGEVAIIRLDNQWQLGFVANAVIRCLVKTTGGTDGWTAANDTSYPFSLNTWYNMTMVYNGSNLLIYVNSVLVKTATVTGTIAYTSGGFVFMGRWTENMNGNIANCQIYNRPLSAANVLQNYNATKGRYGLA